MYERVPEKFANVVSVPSTSPSGLLKRRGFEEQNGIDGILKLDAMDNGFVMIELINTLF